jgi:hypothetical protein
MPVGCIPRLAGLTYWSGPKMSNEPTKLWTDAITGKPDPLSSKQFRVRGPWRSRPVCGNGLCLPRGDIQMWPFSQNQLAPIIIGSVGFVFFLALTVYSYRQRERGRGYILGLILIAVASLNMLVRGWFFPTSSSNPAQTSGLLRLANGLLALAGGIMLEREWRRQRKQPQ